MDLLLLAAQVVLIVLLVVLPLFSAYDKWQLWPTRRKLIALASRWGSRWSPSASTSGSSASVTATCARRWERRALSRRLVRPADQLHDLGVHRLAGRRTMLLALSFDAARRKKWSQTAGYAECSR